MMACHSITVVSLSSISMLVFFSFSFNTMNLRTFSRNPKNFHTERVQNLLLSTIMSDGNLAALIEIVGKQQKATNAN